MRKVTLAALAFVAMASCTKTDSEMDLALDGEVRIISSISSRASGDSWAENDEIGVYMNLTGGVLGALGSNKAHITTAGDGNFTATPPLYFPTSGKVDLLAYYPHNSTVGFEPTEYAVNVSSQASLPAIDLMLATATGLDKSSNSVKLTFAHKLSNIVITITNGDGFTTEDLKTVSVSLTGTKAVASYDLTEVDNPIITFDTETKASSITIPTTSNGTRAEAIVIPQSLSSATLEFRFTGDDNVYSAPIKTAAYLAGNTYSYTAEIKKTGVTLSAANITQWVKGNGDNGEGLTAEKVILDMEYKDGIFEIYTDKGLKAFADLVNGVVNESAKVTWGDSELSFTTARKPSINGKLMDNIDLSEICGEEIGVDESPVDWTPISNTSTTSYTYNGTFDGNGKIVEGLYINTTTDYYSGLFGFVIGATIKNVGVKGEITGKMYVGGVVGHASTDSFIAGCHSDVTISASSGYTGGVVGRLYKSTLIASYNKGDITGTSTNSNDYGGVVGYVSESTLISCYNTGGIYSTGSNSYYFGGVSANASNSRVIMDCYWVDIADDKATYGNGDDSNDLGATKCADITTLNNSIDGLNEGIALWNIANSDNQIPWLFAKGGDENTPPTLIEATSATIDGLSFAADCYEISSAKALAAFAKLVNHGDTAINGKLTASFSLNTVCGDGDGVDADWTPIADYNTYKFSYYGVFDGNDKTVSDLYINDTYSTGEYKGLFGRIYSATIKNLTVSGTVRGYRYVGGIAGYSGGTSSLYSTITSCHNKVAVYANQDYVGGVVGATTKTKISLCSNSADIQSHASYCGGIVGDANTDTIITSCSNSGTVELVDYSEGFIGGIVGSLNSSNIIDSHNTGDVKASNYSNDYIGGVAGYVVKANMIACSNNAPVMGDDHSTKGCDYIGGIAGCINSDAANKYSVIACYNSGKVSDPSSSTDTDNRSKYLGGVVGGSHSNSSGYDIIACCNIAEVTSSQNTTTVGGIAGYALTSDSYTSNYWYDANNSDKAVNGIGLIEDGSASDTGAEKLDNITALNGKVDALNNAIFTWNGSNSAACPYKYQAGSGETAPTLVAGAPTYTE